MKAGTLVRHDFLECYGGLMGPVKPTNRPAPIGRSSILSSPIRVCRDVVTQNRIGIILLSACSLALVGMPSAAARVAQTAPATPGESPSAYQRGMAAIQRGDLAAAQLD